VSDEGFLSRWSRRKVGARGDAPVAPAAPVPGQPMAAVPAATAPAEADAAAPLPPTLADAQALEPGEEIGRFVAPNVDESVKRVALKRLFADPHFNVMDGLDTYIDDYNRSVPIPPAMLRRMAQAQALGLFADEDGERTPETSPDGAGAAPVPESNDEPGAVPDEDADLRLQQDDAAGPGGAAPGASA